MKINRMTLVIKGANLEYTLLNVNESDWWVGTDKNNNLVVFNKLTNRVSLNLPDEIRSYYIEERDGDIMK